MTTLREPSDLVPLSSSPVDADDHVAISYQPILDVARGVAAGYQAVARTAPDRPVVPDLLPVVAVTRAGLAARASLPPNTFISIPVPLARVDDVAVREQLAAAGDLSGVVLDITRFDSSVAARTEAALDDYRRAGARIAVGGGDDGQPELGSIVRLRPAIIRLGAAWTRDLDQHPSRRSAIEVTGRLAGQLDAWILADEVETAGELRVLAQLGVPLARGPFVGAAQPVWPTIDAGARSALPRTAQTPDGELRRLLQQAYTTSDPDAARSVLPEASGFECVVVIDDSAHPVSILQPGPAGTWEPIDVLTVHVDTSVTDAVARAMARPPATRFSPITCTDAAGRFVGILRIERLVEHLVGETG